MSSTPAAEKMAWSPEGMTQEDFMLKDQCILLDMEDNVIGCDNKYETHIFCPERPRAKLHRAFSVFLFNDKNELLLQQRAASKITFPNVWTNTCCSHPLSGFGGTEVDSPGDVAKGSPQGVMRAAVRKLLHELGVPPSQVPVEKFKFLTRLHYWAADVVTHGPDSPFGEHEIDYILFIKTPITWELNPEEVSAVQYVSLPKLRELMKPTSGLLWSPWFRIIVERFLPSWWEDLDRTLNTDDLVDLSTIHRFDCSSEHRGGHGAAGAWLTTDTCQPGPDGDGWLTTVAANAGRPPATKSLKPLLQKLSNGKYMLNDGAPRQSGAEVVKVYYWNMQGRAGPALRMLTEANVKYEHIQTFKEISGLGALWGAPTETLAPPIIVDGKSTVSQSVAVAAYIGEKYGFPVPDMIRGLQLANNAIDAFESISRFTDDGAKFKEFLFGADGKPGRFARFLGALEHSIVGPFMFGEKKSWVDFIIGSLNSYAHEQCLNIVQQKVGGDLFKDFPKLKALTDAISGLASASNIEMPVIKDSFKLSPDHVAFSKLD